MLRPCFHVPVTKSQERAEADTDGCDNTDLTYVRELAFLLSVMYRRIYGEGQCDDPFRHYIKSEATARQ